MRELTVVAHVGAIVPATVAALARSGLDLSGDLFALGKLNIGNDIELGEVDGLVTGEQGVLLGRDRGLHTHLLALGEGAGGAGLLKCLGNGGTQLERSLEDALELVGGLKRNRALVPIEQRGVLLVVNATGRCIGHDLVGRVGEDGLHVAHEHREQLGHNGLGGAARMRAGLVAVQAVLQGIEIDVGELRHHEVVQRAVGTRELVRGVRIVDLGLDLRQAGDHKLVERGQFLKGHGVLLGLVLALELGKQEAIGVAETTVGVRRAGEDLMVDGYVRGRVDRGDPKADDVGAHLVADGVGVDHVAKRLGHLAALAVKGKALRDDGLEGCDVVCTHRSEQ